MDRDRRGRRRQPDQERGLRPLHPRLPGQWTSKVLRVAMSEEDWSRLESLVGSTGSQAPTQARAHGMVISQLLDTSARQSRPSAGPTHWLDWERQKTLRLLSPAV